MIWPFSLYSELARLTAREAVLASECGTLKAEITALRADRDGLLDRLLVACGSSSMGAPLQERLSAQPAPEASARSMPIARNMRDYTRLAEAALGLQTTQLPDRGN